MFYFFAKRPSLELICQSHYADSAMKINYNFVLKFFLYNLLLVFSVMILWPYICIMEG